MRYRMLAINLAKKFSNDSEIPAKFKNSTTRKEKDSKVLLKFQEDIYFWDHLIERMFLSLKDDQVFRFIDIAPLVDKSAKHPFDCPDFIDFHEYFRIRRDVDNCDDQELGRLSMLLYAFQEKIERIITPKKPITLKNERAQALMEQKTVHIDGIELNLWGGHSFDSVKGQMTWNKIRSFAELNGNSTGENGSIVITGVLQIPRKEAAEYAISLGFKVHSTLSRKTNFLVVGSSNVSPTEIASMQKYNEEGASIKLVEELEFLNMLSEYVN